METSDKYEIVTVDGIEYAVTKDIYKKYMKEVTYSSLLIRSGIPQKYHDLNFVNYIGELSKVNYGRCIKYSIYCDKPEFKDVNLYLTGSYGTQKTTLACSIAKGFLDQGYRAKFVQASDLIDFLMKNQGFSYNEELQKKIDSYLRADLLIIDDFGKGTYWKNSPELIIEAWDKFLRKIISEGKRIVMTSNYSLDYMKKQYGESLYALLHRDFEELVFLDSIGVERHNRFDNLWED